MYPRLTTAAPSSLYEGAAPDTALPGLHAHGKSGPILLAMAVLILAFFLGSTPVRNSDFWLDLATGRALVESGFSFGREPFTITRGDNYWVNPSWLYDVALFGLYQMFGSSALVVAKALLVALIAGLLLLCGNRGNRPYLTGVAVAVGLVALGPWLLLAPACLSFFLGAWTLWYLEARVVPAGKGASWLRFWPMLLVFALWANLDKYFIVGPLLVGMYWWGSLFSTASDAGKSALGWLFFIGLAVCLVNPHHVHVFAASLQLELSGLAAPLAQDPALRAVFVAPMRDVYLSSQVFSNPAGLAFWLLTLVGFLSFVLNQRSWPWSWGLAWATFFLLSLVKTQAIPFFVIVSLPILLQNLSDRLPGRSIWAAPLRVLAVTGAMALAVAAWPGWLQTGPAGPRSWSAEIDPAMSRLGRTWLTWQEQHKISAGHVFNCTPETGNYLAWLCPQLKCYFNSHLQLTAADALDFRAIRLALAGRTAPDTFDRDWRAVLRRHQISLIAVQGWDTGLVRNTLGNLFSSFRECPLLALQGHGAIFGWRDPVNFDLQARLRLDLLMGLTCSPLRIPLVDPYAGLTLDLRRKAFSASSTPLASFPQREPSPLHWWDAFWRPRLVPSVDRDEADTLLNFFEVSQQFQGKRQFSLARSGYLAEIVCAGSGFVAAPLTCSLQAAAERPWMAAFVANMDDGPAEALYLAVRAARAAIQANPDDADAYFLLAEAYGRLGQKTRERNWGPLLGTIRQGQLMAAYRHAVALDPSLWQAHERLADAFKAMEYKDLALEHLRDGYRVLGRLPPRGVSREQFEQQRERLKKEIDLLEPEVQAARDRFDLSSSKLALRVVDQADMAANFGLAGKSLQILLASDIAAFGEQGMQTELTLLLLTGHVEEVENWLAPEHEKNLGPVSYHLIKARMEAALGRYAQAQRNFQAMFADRRPEGRPMPPHYLAAASIGSTLLSAAAEMLEPEPFNEFTFALQSMNWQAKSLVLQGAMALEAGDNRTAADLFRRALTFWGSRAGAAFRDPQSMVGRRMAQSLADLLSQADAPQR